MFYKYWLFVKSGGGKSSITLRDSKLNKLFKVVEFFYPIMYCTQNLGHKIGGAVFMSKLTRKDIVKLL